MALRLLTGLILAKHCLISQFIFRRFFLGRGFGAEPIIAISAPIYANNRDKPVGIVEGSLNLNLFEQVNRHTVE